MAFLEDGMKRLAVRSAFCDHGPSLCHVATLAQCVFTRVTY